MKPHIVFLSIAMLCCTYTTTHAAQVKKEKLKEVCERNGGTFKERTEGEEKGDYECIMPDGRHVYCIGFLEMCEFIHEVKNVEEDLAPVTEIQVPNLISGEYQYSDGKAMKCLMPAKPIHTKLGRCFSRKNCKSRISAQKVTKKHCESTLLGESWQQVHPTKGNCVNL